MRFVNVARRRLHVIKLFIIIHKDVIGLPLTQSLTQSLTQTLYYFYKCESL